MMEVQRSERFDSKLRKVGGHLLEAGKDKETDSSLEPQEGTQSCQHLLPQPHRTHSDISPQESIR